MPTCLCSAGLLGKLLSCWYSAELEGRKNSSEFIVGRIRRKNNGQLVHLPKNLLGDVVVGPDQDLALLGRQKKTFYLE